MLSARFHAQQHQGSARAFAGKGHFGSFLADISQFYLAYHTEYYGRDSVYLHDPTALLGVARKDLFEWQQGAVVVGLEGTLRGKTLANRAHPPRL